MLTALRASNIEGDWDEVFAAVRKCHEAVHAMGAPRIFTTLKVGTEVGRTQKLSDKLASVEKAGGGCRPGKLGLI